MLSELTIPKERSSDPALNQEELYAIGLEYVQELSSRIWTDYNVHDPGITTLELLAYALTDLSYRASFPVKDLLASESDNAAEMQKQFFTARQILPNRSLTLLDYRKLLIDLAGVKNAWLQPAVLSYYADTIEGKLFGPAILYADEITDLPSFADKMNQPADAVSTFLSAQLAPGTHQALDAYADSGEEAPLRTLLVHDINAVIQGDSIYDPQRFEAVTLSAVALALLQQQSPDVVRLNRLLLEDAYPAEIARNPELRVKASLPGVVEVNIRGLYDVIVEYSDNADKTSVPTAVMARLNANRNLCEDFVSLTVVQTQWFSLCAEIDLATDADVEQVKAEIFFQVQQYLAPPVINYTLAEMLARKKSDGSSYTVDEIFDGPALDCGFIDNEELAAAELRTEIRLSDVISIIMDIEGVEAVIDIVINPKDTTVALANKWVVAVERNKKALLYKKLDGSFDTGKSRLVFYKREMPVTADPTKFDNNLLGLETAARIKAETHVAYDLPIPLGQYRSPDDYYSFQNDFPLLYGLSEYGLSSAADDARKALAYQLKGDLLFFDQLLANYFAQLSHVKELFSTDPAMAPSSAGVTFTDGVSTNNSTIYTSARANFVSGDVGRVITGTNIPANTYIASRTDSTTIVLSQNATGSGTGLSFTIRARTTTYYCQLVDSFADYTKIYSDTNALASLERIIETTETADDRRNRFLDHLIARFAEEFTDFANILYSVFGTSMSKNIIEYKCEFLQEYPVISSERSLAYNYTLTDQLWDTTNVSGLEKRLAKLLGLDDYRRRNLSAITKDEGMYLIEMILLRPMKSTDPFVRICGDRNCTVCVENDPYSYRIHIILPAYGDRFKNMDFRRYAEEVIRAETPAHILPRICWISSEEMEKLEKAYKAWLEDPTGNLQALIGALLTVRNVYPAQYLRLCTSTEAKFLLDQSALASPQPTDEQKKEKEKEAANKEEKPTKATKEKPKKAEAKTETREKKQTREKQKKQTTQTKQKKQQKQTKKTKL